MRYVLDIAGILLHVMYNCIKHLRGKMPISLVFFE